MQRTTEPSKSFQTTQWTALFGADRGATVPDEAAIPKVYQSYWVPLTEMLRRRGFSGVDAEDLTQGFFMKLLRNQGLRHLDRAKGRLRDYLSVALRRFALDESGKRRRRPVEYMAEPPESEGQSGEPEHFDRDWAQRLLDLSCQRMLGKLREGRDAKVGEALFRFLLQRCGESRLSEVGASLGLSEAATKMRLLRLRQTWQQILREEITRTVPDVRDVDSEIRHLIRALESAGGSGAAPDTSNRLGTVHAG